MSIWLFIMLSLQATICTLTHVRRAFRDDFTAIDHFLSDLANAMTRYAARSRLTISRTVFLLKCLIEPMSCAELQQFLSRGGLAGVRVRDDGEGASFIDF
jgi:hypothetical protein